MIGPMLKKENTPFLPLMKDAELEYLKSVLEKLPKKAKIVEWGSGGSTLWFLEQIKPTQHLYSIEHNPEWYSIVGDKLKEQSKLNYTYIRFNLQVNIDFYRFATPNEELACGLDYYINPAFDIWDADLFFVDGIARGSVLATILIKSMKKDPFIFIHDYRGREFYYDWAVQLFSKKELVGDTLLKINK